MTLEEILLWLRDRDCQLRVEWQGVFVMIEVVLPSRKPGQPLQQKCCQLLTKDWDNPNKRVGCFLSAIETIMRQIDENA